MIERPLHTTIWMTLILLLVGCATSRENVRSTTPTEPAAKEDTTSPQTRPIPPSISYSNAYRRALARGTRSEQGTPGPDYWQQTVDYDLEARLHPSEKRLDGRANIQYQNNSPDTLESLHVDLLQNVHAPGVMRNQPQEITGGVNLESVVSDGDTVRAGQNRRPRYAVNGTRMIVHPARPIPPGETTRLDISYSFRIPQAGASERMGYEDNLFHIGYWYPQMAVYDDLTGWHSDQYLGLSEFYYDFANYDIQITIPDEWVVMSTGQLRNAEQVLAPHVRQRLAEAEESDETIAVIEQEDFEGGATTESDSGLHTWHFTAEQVRDVAFSATRASYWDAARAPVGDRDGDGETDYTRVDAFYRTSAPLWRESTKYLQHSITFLSDHLAYPYPYPHMTAVEGGGIIGGGMEYPMMTLIGDYNARGDSALYAVTLHELSHMWIPMIVSTDERRYSWIDEGTTTFNENVGKGDYFGDPDVLEFMNRDRATYLKFAGSDQVGEIMRRSNYHYTRAAFIIASYQKPASILYALRSVLGEETFQEALHTFVDTWAYKHPSPYDFFNTFEAVSGRELDWFWHSWYFEAWTLDQAVDHVDAGPDETRIRIEDRGDAVMPVHVTIRHEDGSTTARTIPVERWLQGHRTATISVPASSPVTKVEIDTEQAFPDINRRNNVWSRSERTDSDSP